MSLNKIETPAVKFYLLPRKFGMNPCNTSFKKRQSGQCKNTLGSLGQGNQCRKEPCPGPYANRSTASTQGGTCAIDQLEPKPSQPSQLQTVNTY